MKWVRDRTKLRSQGLSSPHPPAGAKSLWGRERVVSLCLSRKFVLPVLSFRLSSCAIQYVFRSTNEIASLERMEKKSLHLTRKISEISNRNFLAKWAAHKEFNKLRRAQVHPCLFFLTILNSDLHIFSVFIPHCLLHESMSYERGLLSF